jgi:hypothetical protein
MEQTELSVWRGAVGVDVDGTLQLFSRVAQQLVLGLQLIGDNRQLQQHGSPVTKQFVVSRLLITVDPALLAFYEQNLSEVLLLLHVVCHCEAVFS